MHQDSKFPIALVIIVLILAELGIAIFLLNFPEIPKVFFVIIILGIGSQLILTKWFQTEDRAFMVSMFFVAVLLRVALAIIFHNFLSGFFVGDDMTYNTIGRQLAEFWSGKTFILDDFANRRSAGGVAFYSYWNGVLFLIFGYSPLLPKIFNCFVSGFSAVFIYFASFELFNKKVAKIAYLLSLFFPSLILWSTMNIRDPLAIFSIVSIVYHLIMLIKGSKGLKNYAFISIAFGLLLGIRGYMFVVMVISVFFAFFMGQSRSPVRNFVFAFILIIISNMFYHTIFSKQLIDEIDFQKLAKARTGLAYGGSAFLKTTDISTPTKALWYLPVGTVYILFAPFPWQLSSKLQMITAPETLVWYILFFFFLRGLYLLIVSGFFTRIAPVLLPLVAIITTYALVEGNVGTAYRHKAQTLPLFFIIIAVGLNYKNKHRIQSNEFDKNE